MYTSYFAPPIFTYVTYLALYQNFSTSQSEIQSKPKLKLNLLVFAFLTKFWLKHLAISSTITFSIAEIYLTNIS